MIYIYALVCPLENKIRYIGQSKNPKTRYKSHLKDAEKKQNTKKQKWIKHLSEIGLKPLIKIINGLNNPIEARIIEEKEVLKNIDTIYNIHLPGKGHKTVDYYKKNNKLK